MWSVRKHVTAASTRSATQCRWMHALSSNEIKTHFLQYFEHHGHRVVPSASVIPPGSDNSLLFTNAGMVPFKQVFMGTEKRPYTRATSSQRCVRAGGKHNDLEQVGLTRRHHTQFEMLGNFSFGDYFKEQAIIYGWQFLTECLGLPIERLHVTVLHNDDETRRLWRQVAGLPDHKIHSCTEKDNFWAMGDIGPCGPCSEIFWDLGEHLCDPEERYLELWNLVFMQYARQEGSDELLTLPQKCVDTGMGLERIASVLQQVPSNYHTDSFVPILQTIASTLDTFTPRQEFSNILAQELNPHNPQFGITREIQTLRIVADHLRAAYTLLQDGVFPSNIGRGYVLRRIIRRAIRAVQRHGIHDSLLTQIIVPEWSEMRGFPQMHAIIANEEKAFAEMLMHGKKALDRVLCNAHGGVVTGIEAFRLFDTYGIPLDVLCAFAGEHGLQVDTEGFEVTMANHRQQATVANAYAMEGEKNIMDQITHDDQRLDANTFIGYDSLKVSNARLLGVWQTRQLNEDNKLWVAMDPCPFYAESGGQVGDRGRIHIHTNNRVISLPVIDTQRKTVNGKEITMLECTRPDKVSYDILEQFVCSSDVCVDGIVDAGFRQGCEVHHTATHLLQSALKDILGDHITQAGSLVTSNRLRFDFTHFGAMSLDEVKRVEEFVNRVALMQHTSSSQSTPTVQTVELSRQDAEASGAICNFGEKYSEMVRVVTIGDVSSEFCGGTHVQDVSLLFPFVILSEGSVAVGTRRIDAIAGVDGAKFLQNKATTLEELAGELGTTPPKVSERVAKLIRQIKQLESTNQALSDIIASLPPNPAITASEGTIHVHVLPDTGTSGANKILRRRAEYLHKQDSNKTHIVVSGHQVVCITDGADVHAGKYLQTLLKQVGGRGGGSTSFAQGSLGKGACIDDLCQLICSTKYK